MTKTTIDKRTFITTAGVFALALVGALAVSAQEGPKMRRPGPGPGFGGPGDAPRPPMFALLRELNLTDEQREHLRALHEKQRETVEPLVEKAAAAREAFHKALEAENADAQTVGQAALAMRAAQSQVEAAHQSAFGQLKSILTPEQAAKLDEIQKRRPRTGPAGLGGHGGPGVPRRPRPDGDSRKR